MCTPYRSRLGFFLVGRCVRRLGGDVRSHITNRIGNTFSINICARISNSYVFSIKSRVFMTFSSLMMMALFNRGANHLTRSRHVTSIFALMRRVILFSFYGTSGDTNRSRALCARIPAAICQMVNTGPERFTDIRGQCGGVVAWRIRIAHVPSRPARFAGTCAPTGENTRGVSQQRDRFARSEQNNASVTDVSVHCHTHTHTE